MVRLLLLAALRYTKSSGNVHTLVASIAKGLCLGLMDVSFIPQERFKAMDVNSHGYLTKEEFCAGRGKGGHGTGGGV